ncbi:hypothetical protein Tco_0883057 [Tanacetum coccineum]
MRELRSWRRKGGPELKSLEDLQGVFDEEEVEVEKVVSTAKVTTVSATTTMARIPRMCKDPLEEGKRCKQCTCEWCGYNPKEGFCLFCSSRDENSFIDALNPNSFNDLPNIFTHPPQPQYETYSCELYGNDSHYGYDCPPWFPLYSINHQSPIIQENLNQQRMYELLNMTQSFCKKLLQQNQASNIDQSPPQEMSIQDMEDLKQQYLDEMLSMFNQIQIKDYCNEKIDIRYRRECEIMIDELKGKFNGMSIEINKKKKLWQLEHAANLSIYTSEPSRCFNIIYDYDDDEIVSQIPPSCAITPVLPTLESKDSLIMWNEELNTIPKKESEEFIKSSVEDLVPIPSESKDTFGSDSECDLPSCDDFSSIDIPRGNSMTFSNHLTSILKDIESEESYVSKLDEPDLLVIPLSKLNEDECFGPGGDFVLEEIKACLTSDSILPGIDDDDFDPEGDILLLEKLLNDDPLSPLPTKEFIFEELKVIKSDFEDDYYDSKGDIIYLESLLIKDTIPNPHPEVFLDRDPRSLKDVPDKDDLKYIVKVFNPGIHEKTFSPTYVKLPFEDRRYLYLTYVIRIFLSYFTYPVESPFPLSSRSKDIIFDPDISAYSFYSLEPVAYERPMEDCPDYEDSCARGFVHCSLDL